EVNHVHGRHALVDGRCHHSGSVEIVEHHQETSAARTRTGPSPHRLVHSDLSPLSAALPVLQTDTHALRPGVALRGKGQSAPSLPCCISLTKGAILQPDARVFRWGKRTDLLVAAN